MDSGQSGAAADHEILVEIISAQTEIAKLGVLKIASPRPRAFDNPHVRILELMSELIAAAMFHAARRPTRRCTT